jgi:hypothetical protein
VSEKRVSVRVDEDLKNLVKEVVEKTGISETALVEATLKALCDYFQQHGEITLPLVVLPKSKARAPEHSSNPGPHKIASYAEPGQLALAAESPYEGRVFEEEISPTEARRRERAAGKTRQSPGARQSRAKGSRTASADAARSPRTAAQPSKSDPG